jgi:hypothetical protein
MNWVRRSFNRDHYSCRRLARDHCRLPYTSDIEEAVVLILPITSDLWVSWKPECSRKVHRVQVAEGKSLACSHSMHRLDGLNRPSADVIGEST